MDYKKQFMDQVMSEMAEDLNARETQKLYDTLLESLNNVDLVKTETMPACIDNINERYLKRFVASRRLEGLSEVSIRQYVYNAKKFFDFIPKNFNEVTATDVQFYLSNYDKTHNVQKITLENMRKGINGFFVWLLENDYIKSNPVAKVKAIAFEKKTVEALTDYEILKIRDCVFGDYRTRAIVELLLATGVRVSELINIRIKDVNLDKGEVIIHCAKKRRKQDRICFLTAEAEKSIRDYLDFRQRKQIVESEYLFCANRRGGKPITERMVNEKLRSIEAQIGLSQKLTVHAFRRTFATILYSHGCPTADIAFLLGHCDTRMSETYYVSIKNENVKRNYGRYR